MTCRSNSAEFFASEINTSPRQKIGELELPRSQDMVELVTSVWNEEFHAVMPALRKARKSEVLNFTAEFANVLSPADGLVRRLENARINSGTVVLDFMGGEKIAGDFPAPASLPSEVLLLDRNGRFRVQNSYDDLRGLRHALFLPDESNTFGVAR